MFERPYPTSGVMKLPSEVGQLTLVSIVVAPNGESQLISGRQDDGCGPDLDFQLIGLARDERFDPVVGVIRTERKRHGRVERPM